MSTEPIPVLWLVCGFAGQAMFSMRFLIQWIASERRHESVVPVTFWWFSLAGGGFLLAYALRRADPVFVVGQVAGIVVYARNLVLLRRAASAQREPARSSRSSSGA